MLTIILFFLISWILIHCTIGAHDKYPDMKPCYHSLAGAVLVTIGAALLL